MTSFLNQVFYLVLHVSKALVRLTLKIQTVKSEGDTDGW